MKKLSFPLFVVTTVLLSVSSCKSTRKAEKCANNFLKAIIDERYQMANEMFSEEYTKEQRINFFDLFEQENNGILLSFEKDMSFNTSIENGITNVELKYALKFKKSTVEVTIVLIDKGKGFKVFSITE